MAEGHGAVVGVALLDQHMAVEAAHLGDGKDADAAERTGGHRQNFALGDVGAEVALAVTLQAVEGDVGRCDVTFQCATGKVGLAARRLQQTVLDQLRNSWRKMYGPDSEETTVILNDGVDFKDAGQTAVETQLNENKQTNAHEIYRIFNIAPTILEGDATAEDLKNTVRFAIAPVVKALQLAINRFCLLEAEKGVLAFEIDMDALDGTDMLARYQAYEVAIRNGWMQLDEVRYDEGRNPLGLKFIRLGLDTVIYDPESRMIYTPNTKEWASIDQKGGGEPIAGRDPSG